VPNCGFVPYDDGCCGLTGNLQTHKLHRRIELEEHVECPSVEHHDDEAEALT